MQGRFVKKIVGVSALAGSVIGWLVLHPLSKAIDNVSSSETVSSIRPFASLLVHLRDSFTPQMLPMSILYGILGMTIALVSSVFIIFGRRRRKSLNDQEAATLGELLKQGESEVLEFKSSGRWDLRLRRVNKELEQVIAKSIVGFMNHKGGDLLIGVDDRGIPIGLDRDYSTLQAKNRDGFECWLMALINTRLGGRFCSKVHCSIHQFSGKEVCRVGIEASIEPVFFRDGNNYRYFTRAGNSTRELDAMETMSHVENRRCRARFVQSA